MSLPVYIEITKLVIDNIYIIYVYLSIACRSASEICNWTCDPGTPIPRPDVATRMPLTAYRLRLESLALVFTGALSAPCDRDSDSNLFGLVFDPYSGSRKQARWLSRSVFPLAAK